MKYVYLCAMNHTEIEECIRRLDQLIAQNPQDEKLWVERGSLYWKLQDWSRCLSDFDHAILLNPNSPAAELRKSVMQIISFYYKDRYNP